MEKISALYEQHISVLQQRARVALERQQLDAMLIHSGELVPVFLDDQYYPFKVNAHFKAWVPITHVPNCWLLTDGVSKPKLWFYSPIDYWNHVEPLPESFWTDSIDIQVLRKPEEINLLLPAQLSRRNIGYLGSAPETARLLAIQEQNINPTTLINYLHYYRSFKTDYELLCMKQAQKMAVYGHRAAKEAFLSGQSEYDINLAYLTATGHRDTDVPYDNIVALNEHASVLHYTRFDSQPPEERRSFLIDAGAEYNGYAADLTRTYAAKGHNEFAELITDVNRQQLKLIDEIKSGVRFTEYHIQMHHRLAHILKKHDIITGIDEEAMVAIGITSPFLPHGLGHPLGLQVHDVAGFMQDDGGTHLAAPEKYPFLRCTRILEPGMVMTIEPGLYFIDSLLDPWKETTYKAHFNWQKINILKPYGGIRIEDNIVIHNKSVENMTRDLSLA